MMGKFCVQNQVRNADAEESDSEKYPPTRPRLLMATGSEVTSVTIPIDLAPE